MFFNLLSLSASIQVNPVSCYKPSVFSVKRFDIIHPNNTRGVMLSMTLIANLLHKVEHPYIEGQLLTERVPVLRFKDTLCRPGVLTCPASFSTIHYGNQIVLPSTLEIGDYKLKLLFKEDRGLSAFHDIIACLEVPVNIKPLTEDGR